MLNLKFKTMKKRILNIFYFVLCAVVDFQIKYDLFENRNNLKKGDKVKYNWKARACIDTAIANKKQIKIVDCYELKDNSCVMFTDGDSCDPFWVSKM